MRIKREASDELRTALKAVIEEVGSMRALGRLINISQQAISQWDRIPGKHIIEIERATGMPRNVLRPDLYRGYSSVDEAIAFLGTHGYRVSKPRTAKSKVKATVPRLNAVGKPYGANFDPAYNLKYKPSYGHLRAPYGPSMRFIGDPPGAEKTRGRRRPVTPAPLLDSPVEVTTESASKTAPEKTIGSDAAKAQVFVLSFYSRNGDCAGSVFIDVREDEIGKAGALFAAIRKSIRLGIHPGPNYSAEGREVEIAPDAIPEDFKCRLFGRPGAEWLGGETR